MISDFCIGMHREWTWEGVLEVLVDDEQGGP